MSADLASSTPPPEPTDASPRGAMAQRPVLGERGHVETKPTGKRLGALSLATLGVVFGDIGTSPLYALQQCFSPQYGLHPTRENVYGILSLIVWALLIVVTLKYVVFVLRADNRGEGGILSMLALILRKRASSRSSRAVLVAVGLIGAALLYGDGMITPAISVLGAMEGLVVVSPLFAPFVVPATIVVLLGFFLVQRFGTAAVGFAFGPVMLVWFLTLGALGTMSIAREFHILAAVNPLWAVRFFVAHGTHAFVVLGAVVLVVTGAEALYADMGHFGRRPIRVAWFALVLPALLLNYFGQGALLLQNPAAAENPFFMLAPRALLYPLVALSTAAAIIASQAMLSGAFSLTQQCIQLGYSPRMTIVHTSAREYGQIYMPQVNAAIATGTLIIVLGFRSVTALSAAYGIAVTGTFVMTSLLTFVVMARRWHWPIDRVVALISLFLLIDLSLFGANVLKVAHGGWVPLALAGGLFLMMTTWKRGRLILRERLQEITMPLDDFLKSLSSGHLHRVSGTAVFMTSEPAGAPVVLLHHLKHNQVLHEQVILLSITTAEVPEVRNDERVTIERLDHGFIRATALFGFMETPNVPKVMQLMREQGLRIEPMRTSYYLGREQLIPVHGARRKGGMTMNIWRKRLFAVMARNAQSAAAFFQLTPNRVVELGTQIEF